MDIYQNLTQFATTVEALSEKEAIRLAKELDNWDEYEPTDDNIFYDTAKFKD